MIKTFKETTTTEGRDDFLKENRLLRKGAALLLARSAKKHGDTAQTHFNNAQRTFANKSDQNLEDQMKTLLKGLNEMAEGLVNLRRQNGSITGIATAAVLFNERTNKQISLLLKKRR
jgi:hypothetical protein